MHPLTTEIIGELLVEVDVPTLVRRVRTVAVTIRRYPSTATADEIALIADLVQLRPGSQPPYGVPASAVGALAATLTRERGDLDPAAVRAEARSIAQHAIDVRAVRLAALVAVP